MKEVSHMENFQGDDSTFDLAKMQDEDFLKNMRGYAKEVKFEVSSRKEGNYCWM